MMDVSFNHGSIDAELLSILKTEIDSRSDQCLIDGLKSFWSESVDGAVERIVLGNLVAIKVRETAQGITVGDSLSQLPIIPILDAHENERTKDLRSSQPVSSRSRFLQSSQ